MDPVKTILIIDDEPDFREIFSTKLSGAGYHTETASGGEEGIRKVEELHPDLILLDMNMPGMNGGEVLAKLRENPANQSSKIIFLTNLGDASNQGIDDEVAKKFGADGYLRKTEDLSALVALADRFLKK
jgi:CheY-like chemotaxis protein